MRKKKECWLTLRGYAWDVYIYIYIKILFIRGWAYIRMHLLYMISDLDESAKFFDLFVLYLP